MVLGSVGLLAVGSAGPTLLRLFRSATAAAPSATTYQR
jgi:hypothetical protein